jgi:hypothetical protein
VGRHEGAFGGGVDCAAFVQEVDGYEGFVEAEEDECLAEDGAGRQTVRIFVWDYEGSLVCLCTVVV